MRTHACMLLLLLGTSLGCSDPATIGGLCLFDCAPPDADAAGCRGPGCDAGVDAGSDACAAGGCMPACSQGSYVLTRTEAALMLVVDDSASLAPWWPAMNDGLLQFLQGTAASGLAVGLQRFGEECEAEPYSNPLVGIAPLTENLPALLRALPFEGAVSTSTIPALDGVLRYARTWAAAHSDARVSVVLLTDASPGACDGFYGDHEAEAQRIARAAYEGVPSIKTYVVGFSVLQATGPLALAGGTQPAPIGVTPADGEVRTALEKVRQDAQACEFRLGSGLRLAADSTIVVTSSNGSERRYPILSSRAGCTQQDGFYVEDPTSQYPLVACASTCGSLVASDRMASSSACASP